tara:strand:- start:8334 stop:8642 length:309 start_codon:yes stop_codon:yes gene_type:complete
MIPATTVGEQRKKEILRAAIRVAKAKGYMLMSRDEIALEANCANGSVNRYFGSMEVLRNAVMIKAVADYNLVIIGQGLAMRHPVARKASRQIKETVATRLIS